MAVTFAAGEDLTAAKLNLIAGIGSRVLRVKTTTDSSTWNSATKVVTNLAGTFTPDAIGSIYTCWVTGTINCTTVSQTALGIAWRDGGAIVAGSTVESTVAPRCETATGLTGFAIVSEFTVASTNVHGVGVLGWHPTGDTGVAKLLGNATYSINSLIVCKTG